MVAFRPRLRGWQAAALGFRGKARGGGFGGTLGGQGALPAASTDSWALLAAEPQGLAIDFTTYSGIGSVTVLDSTTQANNLWNQPVNPYLTQAGTSAKWVQAASGLWVQKAVGTVAIEYNGGYYALVEPAATNLTIQDSDFTQAAWVKSNMTAAKTATGPDGAANSASTLTATAGNATALQAITSASASRVSAPFIKRRTGTGNIDVTQDNGGTWATQTLTTSWARFPIAAATAANPTVGIRIVTSGDAVDVAWFQHELAVVTSPTPTTTVAVTRGADGISVLTSAFPYNSTVGAHTVLVTFTHQVLVAGANTGIYDLGANENGRMFAYNDDTQLLSATKDNAAVQTSGINIVGLIAAGAKVKMAHIAALNDVELVTDGVSRGTDVVAAAGTVANALRIGTDYTAASQTKPQRFHSLVYLPRRVASSDAIVKTAP